MRALWLEDHQLIGDSLGMLLQVVMPELSLDKARTLQAARQLVGTIRYELILLDWWLGALDGETALQSLRAAGCAAPVIVVSGDERAAVRQRALALGAVGFVSKAADPSTLIDAIRAVLPLAPRAGATVPPPQRPHGPSQGVTARIDALYPSLTARQIDVFRLLMRGLSDKQIARELGIAESTVKSHVQAILQVVGVRRRGEAAYEARLRGVGES